jgi:ubiquinone biosynthesis protein
MLDPALTPSALVAPADRPAVVIVEPRPPSRFRGKTVVARLLGWALGALWLRARGRWGGESNARRVRELLEDLGGIWIKVGQLLSLRIDLFSIELCRELTRLQDTATGFPPLMAHRTIEADLGASLHEIFDVFDDQPIAAASIGQVHRARLRREGVWVAVKVRRPFIETTFAQEVTLVRLWVRVLEALRVLPFIQWRHMQWELERILHEELDYRVEGSAIERMRRSLEPHRMYVPAIYGEYTTARVLVMELVTGVQMSDYIKLLHANPARVRAWERENDVDPHRVVRRFSHSILRQIFEDNLYHGDLHPGNIVLLRHSRVALLDFGTVGFTERAYLEKFGLFMSSLARDEFEKAADMALMMAGPLPRADLGQIRGAVVRELRTWRARTAVRTLPYPLKSVDSVNVAITKILFHHRITFDWAFLRIRRALATMDASAMHLFPGADYTRIIAAYFGRAERRLQRRQGTARAITNLGARLPAALALPEQLVESADLMVQIQRRQIGALRHATGGATMLIHAASLTLGVALSFIWVVSALIFLGQWTAVTGPSTPILDVQVWVVLLAINLHWAALTLRIARLFAHGNRAPVGRSAAFAGVDGTPVARRKARTPR